MIILHPLTINRVCVLTIMLKSMGQLPPCKLVLFDCHNWHLLNVDLNCCSYKSIVFAISSQLRCRKCQFFSLRFLEDSIIWKSPILLIPYSKFFSEGFMFFEDSYVITVYPIFYFSRRLHLPVNQ